MVSGHKADLARAGTMEVTSKEGRAYLEKNLTEWKKPLLVGTTVGDCQTDSSAKESAKGGKKSTKKTAFQGSDNEEEPQPTKKAKLSKATTMVSTAKEGKQLLGGQKLGDTRQVTKAKQKSAVKRANTMQNVVNEATAYGYGAPSGKRDMRKRVSAQPVAAKVPKTKKSPKKAKKTVAKKGGLKKAGTMVKTAKEGKQLIGNQQLGDTRQVTKQKQKQKKRA